MKRLTKKQLADIVDVYHTKFSQWTVIGGERLVRLNGPVLQQIGFEILRSGAYRPSSGVRFLVAPGAAMLHQFLDIRHREILLREHGAAWERVIDAMEQQFVPSVRNPLRVEEVRDLCEHAAGQNTNACYGLAALNAYLGDTSRALVWCDRLNASVAASDPEPAAWQLEHLEFGRKLRDAIQEGKERSFLETEMTKETQLLGQ
ncbi:MAG: hypothetical protein NTY19_04765 [Planctomycetota bacterium]|nr:hypothetical protein [Planctomycetota bacterium]